MSLLDGLDPKYRVILCDVWGVIHDGHRILPGASQRLERWQEEGRRIFLLTNAPRPAATVADYLSDLGLPSARYDAIVSSGEAGIAALTSPPRPVGFLGTAEDRVDLVAGGVLINSGEQAEIACTGLDERRTDPADYADEMRTWAEAGTVLHCLNPDRVVIHQGRREACAGALADMYEALGGQVEWYGKPYRPIYDYVRALADNPHPGAMLAIGDGQQTDMLGAARYGIDAIYVSHGIHGGQPVSADFATRHGLGNWKPILTVEGLG